MFQRNVQNCSEELVLQENYLGPLICRERNYTGSSLCKASVIKLTNYKYIYLIKAIHHPGLWDCHIPRGQYLPFFSSGAYAVGLVSEERSLGLVLPFYILSDRPQRKLQVSGNREEERRSDPF